MSYHQRGEGRFTISSICYLPEIQFQMLKGLISFKTGIFSANQLTVYVSFLPVCVLIFQHTAPSYDDTIIVQFGGGSRKHSGNLLAPEISLSTASLLQRLQTFANLQASTYGSECTDCSWNEALPRCLRLRSKKPDQPHMKCRAVPSISSHSNHQPNFLQMVPYQGFHDEGQ